MAKLTLNLIPYTEIEDIGSVERIKKILDLSLKNKIVILQGKLEPSEEASLIQSTMALVGKVKGFKGVEIAVIQPNNTTSVLEKLKFSIARALIGDRDVLTVIGPAAVVKEIKKDPKKIELMLKK